MKVVTAFFTGNRMDRTRLVLDLGENRNLKMLVAYVDGGSRGNPGPAGYGVYILDENGNELKQSGTGKDSPTKSPTYPQDFLQHKFYRIFF